MDLARAVHWRVPCSETEGRDIVRLPLVKRLVEMLPELPDLPPLLEKILLLLFYIFYFK